MKTITYESPVNGFCEEMIVVDENTNGYFVKKLDQKEEDVIGVFILKSHTKKTECTCVTSAQKKVCDKCEYGEKFLTSK